MTEPLEGPVLVLAPHPDDETLGLGGTLALHSRRGDRVRVVVLTRGEGAKGRLAEFEEALEILGLSESEAWDYGDGALSEAADLADRILGELESLRPKVLYAPHPSEEHPDHGAAGRAAAEAVERCAAPPVLAFYEVGTALQSTHRIDTTAVQEVKERAMEAYASQRKRFDFLTVIQGRDRFRSYGLPAPCRFAEAFRVLLPKGALLATDRRALRHIEEPRRAAMSEKGPKISVILRSYRRPMLLAQALLSLAGQDYQPFEAVVVNAGLDDLDPVLERFGPLLDLEVVQPEGELNRPAALNVGLEAATGEVIAYLDDDDVYLEGHLAAIASAFQNPSVQVAYTGALVRPQAHEAGRQEPARRLSRPFDRDVLLFGNFVPLICLAHRASCVAEVGTFDESLDRFEDWDWLLRLSERFEVLHIPTVTAEYRLGESQHEEGEAFLDAVFQRHGTGVNAHTARRVVRLFASELDKRDVTDARLQTEIVLLGEEAHALEQSLAAAARKGPSDEETALRKLVREQARDLYIKRTESARLRKKVDEDVLRRAVDVARPRPQGQNGGPLRSPEGDLLTARVASTSGWRRTFLAAAWVLLHQGPTIFAKKAFRQLFRPGATDEAMEGYHSWFEAHYRNVFDPADAGRRVSALANKPLLSLVLPAYEPDIVWLEKALSSIRAQSYDKWELCIVDDGSQDGELNRFLEEAAHRDERIRLHRLSENSGIAAATNAGLALARGDFVGFLDQDDELPPWALLDVAEALEREPDADMVYTDEDKIDRHGLHREPYFKPDWSPDLLLSHNYLCHLLFLRADFLRDLGGLREGYDGAQDYDLVLRATEKAERIVHVPRVCYHWRRVAGSTAVRYRNKPEAETVSLRALNEALVRRDEPGEASRGLFAGSFRVRRTLEIRPTVSIVIPMRDNAVLLRNCLDSIAARTNYDDYEVLVVDNGSQEAETLEYLAGLDGAGKTRVLSVPGPFNFPALNNRAARQARGQVLLLLNNDVEVLSPGWLEAMVEHAVRPEVGAVGAKLLYADGSVQHAGVVTGLGGVAGHAFKYFPKYSRGSNGHIDLIRNYSAVTGACMMVRRAVWDEVGGMDESLPRAFNDVDFCLRLREKGYIVVYTPYAVLTHLESASRGFVVEGFEIRTVQKKWGDVLMNDPYYNPNLTLDREDFSLR